MFVLRFKKIMALESKFPILKNKLLSLVFIVATLALTGCVSHTDVANMSSSESLTGVGVVYVPGGTSTRDADWNPAYITHVDSKSVFTEAAIPPGRRTRSQWANTVYVNPGEREIEVHALWNDTEYYTALRINVRRGHSYRIVFDKPSGSFSYRDMGSNMEPSDMRRWE